MARIFITILKYLTALLTSLFLFSCQYTTDVGKIIKEERTVESFNEVKVSTGIEVILTQSSNRSVTVEAGEKVIKNIETKVVGNTLRIGIKKSTKFRSFKKIIVYVSNADYYSITSSSGSEVKYEGTLTGETLYLNSSSGSSMKLKIEYDQVNVDLSSGSDMKLEGLALNLNTSTSSGSSLNAKGLKANDIVAGSSSSSDQKLFPIISLEAKSSSGSSINYYNKPSKESISKSSGGSVNDRS